MYDERPRSPDGGDRLSNFNSGATAIPVHLIVRCFFAAESEYVMNQKRTDFVYPENATILDSCPESADGSTGKVIDMTGNGVMESKDANSNIDASDVPGHVDTQVPVSE